MHSDERVLLDLVSKYMNPGLWIDIGPYDVDKDMSRLFKKITEEYRLSQKSIFKNSFNWRIPTFERYTIEEDIEDVYLSRPCVSGKLNDRKHAKRNQKVFRDNMKKFVNKVAREFRKEYPYSTSNTVLKMFHKWVQKY
jgi:hypothetical protein